MNGPFAATMPERTHELPAWTNGDPAPSTESTGRPRAAAASGSVCRAADTSISTPSAGTQDLNEHSMVWSDTRATDRSLRVFIAASLGRNRGNAASGRRFTQNAYPQKLRTQLINRQAFVFHVPRDRHCVNLSSGLRWSRGASRDFSIGWLTYRQHSVVSTGRVWKHQSLSPDKKRLVFALGWLWTGCWESAITAQRLSGDA